MLLLLASTIPSRSGPLGPISAAEAARANNALHAWQIGLGSAQEAGNRSFGTWANTGYDPANYMTVTDDFCNDPGVPSDLAAACPFTGTTVIGICQVREYNGTAEIADTTLLIRASYQNDPGVGPALKQAAWTHEVGHCLGMQHTQQHGNIMQPYISYSALNPSSAELDAVASAYRPTAQAPSASITSQYFMQESGLAVRQFTMPVFHIPTIAGANEAAAHAQIMERPLKGPVTVINQLLHSDGTEEIVIQRSGRSISLRESGAGL